MTVDELFDVFWSSYPRRVAKGEARKAWAKLRPTPELVRHMLSTLSWQRNSDQWTRDGGQFIPHPATWLRAERWEDEPVKVTSVARYTRETHAISEAQKALDALIGGTNGQQIENGADRGADALSPSDSGESRRGHLRALRGGHGQVSDNRAS